MHKSVVGRRVSALTEVYEYGTGLGLYPSESTVRQIVQPGTMGSIEAVMTPMYLVRFDGYKPAWIDLTQVELLPCPPA